MRTGAGRSGACKAIPKKGRCRSSACRVPHGTGRDWPAASSRVTAGTVPITWCRRPSPGRSATSCRHWLRGSVLVTSSAKHPRRVMLPSKQHIDAGERGRALGQGVVGPVSVFFRARARRHGCSSMAGMSKTSVLVPCVCLGLLQGHGSGCQPLAHLRHVQWARPASARTARGPLEVLKVRMGLH